MAWTRPNLLYIARLRMLLEVSRPFFLESLQGVGWKIKQIHIPALVAVLHTIQKPPEYQ